MTATKPSSDDVQQEKARTNLGAEKEACQGGIFSGERNDSKQFA